MTESVKILTADYLDWHAKLIGLSSVLTDKIRFKLYKRYKKETGNEPWQLSEAVINTFRGIDNYNFASPQPWSSPCPICDGKHGNYGLHGEWYGTEYCLVCFTSSNKFKFAIHKPCSPERPRFSEGLESSFPAVFDSHRPSGPPVLDNFINNLAKAIGFNEYVPITESLKRKILGYGDSAEQPMFFRVLNALERGARKYKAKNGTPPVLILDNISELGKENVKLLTDLQDIAKDFADQSSCIIVFVSSEGAVPRMMMQRSS
ncbi:hypothetical protein RclHR1_16510009 [Rhizophagus clarus]|uniref:ATPase AAA-type core domain-containing protein n=1 Tax=Rhizophagus clarus TaxID=94130 RepID=A0A2Z6QI54_9GLOM|nr:hypothetical protein RclHR1_16510009 [Rhizophagus clarus]